MASQPGQPIKPEHDDADWQEWKRQTKAEGLRYRRSLYRRIEDACRLRGRRRARTGEARRWKCGEPVSVHLAGSSGDKRRIATGSA